MNKYILVLLLAGVLFSCNQNEDYPQHFSFDFYPRDCNYAWMNFYQIQRDSNATFHWETNQPVTEKTITSDKLLINILTHNMNKSLFYGRSPWDVYSDSIRNNIAAHNLQIEKQIEDSYTRTNRNNTSSSSSEIVAAYPIEMEYRLTEVKNLTISSNVRLFGQAAGSSLNSDLEIYSITPEFIFSAQDRLLMGFDQWEDMKGMSISQWLNMHPLAAASMSLHFKTVPSEAPIDAKIILTMEMAGGAVLRDTSSVITLLP